MTRKAYTLLTIFFLLSVATTKKKFLVIEILDKLTRSSILNFLSKVRYFHHLLRYITLNS